jgi:hypothetical protein
LDGVGRQIPRGVNWPTERRFFNIADEYPHENTVMKNLRPNFWDTPVKRKRARGDNEGDAGIFGA